MRIAILDTGIDYGHPYIMGARDRIKGVQSWVGYTFVDTCGHGTHIAQYLLQTAPKAEIFVAKISEGKSIQNADHVGNVS